MEDVEPIPSLSEESLMDLGVQALSQAPQGCGEVLR